MNSVTDQAGGPLWFFVGDSHVHTVQLAYKLKLFKGQPAKFLSIGGATASGLRMDKESKTGAFKTFTEALVPHNPGYYPILQLGEIDCGFIIWYRAKKYDETPASQLVRSLDTYLQFIRLVRDAGYGRDMLVTSAVLPTILDGQLEGEIAHARSEITATFRERTDLTLDYNAGLAERCAAEGVPFLDVTSRFLDPETRLIDDVYRHPNKLDHHMNPITAGPIWFEEVKRTLG